MRLAKKRPDRREADSSNPESWRERCLSLQTDFGWFLAACDGLKPAPFIDQAYIRALAECWVRPESLVMPIARYLAAKWPRALTGIAAPGELQLFEVVRDPLLLMLLQHTPALTPGLEKLLARVRHGALRAVMERRNVDAFVPTMTALAIRGWHSGYALTLPLEARHDADRALEQELVPELGRQLARGERNRDELPAAVAVYAAYAPPEPAHLRAALATNDPAVSFIEENVTLPSRRQREIARTMTPATSIDESSAQVAAQYEAHPYPAWVGEPAGVAPLPPAVVATLGEDGPRAIRSVLVAGCGTGQHALVAARAWPCADILAIDLSRTSLAYAIDRTGARSRERIRFALADLLAVRELGQRFEVIEAMGVLHHLDDPEAGLRALMEVLQPGGIIGIGLYSAAARARLDVVRQRFGRDDALTDDEVRSFRAWALAGLDAPDLLHSPDFYSIGGCRDAFFHVREHRYSLDQIGEMLDRAGLTLLAVQTPSMAAERLAALPDPADLAGWAAAEREHDDLFLGMYELWARAPAG